MKKRSLLLALLLVFTLGFTACGGEDAKDGKGDAKSAPGDFKDAASHLAYASMNSMSLDGMNVEAKISVKGNFKPYLEKGTMDKKYHDFVNELINTSKINYSVQYKIDDENKVPMFDVKYGLINNDKQVVDLNIFHDKKNLGIAFPAVSKKAIVVDPKILTRGMNKEELTQLNNIFSLDLKKYRDIILSDKSLYDFYNTEIPKIKEVYDNYLNETFEKTETTSIEVNGENIDVTEYKGKLDFKKGIELNIKLMEIIRDDEESRNLFIDKALLVMDEFIKSEDYKVFEIEKEDVEEAKKSLEAIKKEGLSEEYKAELEEGIKQYKESLNSEEFKKLENFNMEMLYRINSDNKLESFVMNAKGKFDPNVDEELEVVLEAKYSDEVNIVGSENYEAFDLSEIDIENAPQELKNNKEFGEFAKNFLLDVVNYADGSENLKPIYDLMEKNKLNNELNMIKSSISQAKGMLESMSPEQLIGMMGLR